MRTHKTVECGKCNIYYTANIIGRHIKKCKGKKQHKCTCCKTYKHKTDLYKHQKNCSAHKFSYVKEFIAEKKKYSNINLDFL